MTHAALVACGLVLLVTTWLSGSPESVHGFPLDDAWIHLVYGRQLARDGLLAYNPGVPATGATSPLWALCLGLLHVGLGSADADRIVLATYGLGIALHLGTIWGVIRLARAAGLSLLGAAAAALCFSAAPLLALSAFSGMEVSLTAFLLVIGHERLLRRSWALAGTVLGLAAYSRPEAASCFPGAVLWLLCTQNARERASAFLRFVAVPILLGATLVAHNLWASGRPLPSTYYFKQTLSMSELPARARTAVARLISEIAPFRGGWLWLGVPAYGVAAVLARRRGESEAWSTTAAPCVPLLAGLAFLVGNVAVIAPHDPAAYYHQRYVLPAVPLLIVGLLAGFDRLSLGRITWQRRLPLALVTALSTVGGLLSAPAVSRHFHSDVRNINELQRALGVWFANETEPGSWIATVDAGAIRYFSDRPVIDIMGLNTPELYWEAPDFAAKRPVRAIALMPAWFPEVRGPELEVLREVRSTPYTVTSNPAMGWQVALGCKSNAVATTAPVALSGLRRVLLYCAGR